MANTLDEQPVSTAIDDLSASKTRKIISWVLVLIIVGVFLPSIPFLFHLNLAAHLKRNIFSGPSGCGSRGFWDLVLAEPFPQSGPTSSGHSSF